MPKPLQPPSDPPNHRQSPPALLATCSVHPRSLSFSVLPENAINGREGVSISSNDSGRLRSRPWA
ncbi:hypothetical protein PanWU01x14_217670, partial [Parasponia andersonii]